MIGFFFYSIHNKNYVRICFLPIKFFLSLPQIIHGKSTYTPERISNQFCLKAVDISQPCISKDCLSMKVK